MRQRAYLETTVVGYLVAQPTRDIVTAAHQQITREWWQSRREAFDLFVSQFVLDEAGAGGVAEATARLDVLTDIPVLRVTEETVSLAQEMARALSIPDKARMDSFLIAIAVINGMDYLLTWNCAHIANAALLPRIEALCRARGYSVPVICTPEQLMEG